MIDYKIYKKYVIALHLQHKLNMPTHVVNLLFKPKKKDDLIIQKSRIRTVIRRLGSRAFYIDNAKITFLKQVGEGYRGEAFAVQHVLLDKIFPHTFKILRVRKQVRYAQLSMNQRIGATYTLRAESLDSLMSNLVEFSLPKITLIQPTEASKDILIEKKICVTQAKRKKSSKTFFSFPLRFGLNKLLFFYGFEGDYRTYHAFLEQVYYGFRLEFESAISNFFYTRLILSHFGIPIN